MTLYPQYDMDTGMYEIWVSDERMRPMPAGPRIFRAPPLPDVKFCHEDMSSAQKDCRTIMTYLSTLKKQPTKKEIKEYAE